MKIIACNQYTSEWEAARLGKVTASEADALLTPLFKVKTGAGVRSYLCAKLAERLMGYRGQGGGSFASDQGHVVEGIAVPWYAFTHDAKVERAGFCVSDCGRYGCSPDGLVGEEGGLEIKSPQAPHHVEYLLAGVVPPEYRVQVQFSLFVTGRAWWDFVSFHRYLPALVVRVTPEPEAQKAIKEALASFTAELDAAEAKVRAMMETKAGRDLLGQPHAAEGAGYGAET